MWVVVVNTSGDVTMSTELRPDFLGDKVGLEVGVHGYTNILAATGVKLSRSPASSLAGVA